MWLLNAALSLVLSLATGDHSWVDRLWSVTPALYATHFAAASIWALRPTLMAGLAFLWAARLSLNFARKAGFQVGEEDYRWAAIRRVFRQLAPRWHALLWQLFNVTFICLYQHALLLLLALPAHYASTGPLGLRDAGAALGFLSALLLETVADEQQWAFQAAKRHLRPRHAHLRGDYDAGFLTHGLFAWSRHPNFFAEQCLWWAFWLFAPAPPAAAGAVLLSLLFQGSTAFTERLTLEKYPAYREYQKRVRTALVPVMPAQRCA
jgi:steroid 5-alpha reductase family enzyme